MTSIIQVVINAFEKMIADFGQLVKDALASMESIGSRIAGDIKTTSREIFTGIRTRISSAIQAIKTRLQSKKFNAGHAGGEATAFKNKIETMLTTLVADVQSLFDRFRDALKVILTDSKDAIEHVESKLGPVVKDVGDHVDTAIRDFVSALKDVATKSATVLEAGVHNISHVVDVSADFVYHHGMEIAETAAISVIQPTTIVLFLAAGGFVYLGTTYEPT